MEKENGPVGTDGAKKITAEIGTKEAGTKMTIVPGGRTGMIKSGIVPDGRTGTTLKKMKATSGMVGRTGVADVGCLAKVRWLTRPAASKGSCSQMRIWVGRRSSRRVRSRSLVLSSSLSTVQGLSLGSRLGGALLCCCGAVSHAVRRLTWSSLSLVSECGSSYCARVEWQPGRVVPVDSLWDYFSSYLPSRSGCAGYYGGYRGCV